MSFALSDKGDLKLIQWSTKAFMDYNFFLTLQSVLRMHTKAMTANSLYEL